IFYNTSQVALDPLPRILPAMQFFVVSVLFVASFLLACGYPNTVSRVQSLVHSPVSTEYDIQQTRLVSGGDEERDLSDWAKSMTKSAKLRYWLHRKHPQRTFSNA
ncbi:hypothetical protein L917_14328, partial [Phytophthora nicotianae]